MQKSKFSRYNDGVVYIYREEEGRKTDFSAKKNVKALEDMEYIVKLTFEEALKREQDIEFAQQNGFTLALKIKTRLCNEVDNKCKAVIDGYLYDVSYLDIDRRKAEMWLYLQGVKEI